MTRRILQMAGSACLAAIILSTGALAQDWRGMARVGGKVLDAETGAPIEGVTVKAMLPRSGNRGLDSKSNAKGEWAIGGVATGEWAVDFIKDGYETRSITLPIGSGSGRPIEIRLKKKAAPVVDPNAAIKDDLLRAAGMLEQKQYAAARTVYEGLAAKFPEVKQFRPLIARTYYLEGNKTQAIEHLRQALAQDPENVEVKMLLGNTLMEDGKAEEARQILTAVDDTKITDPAILLNIGIGLINDKKHAEAVPWFDKVIARFPEQPDSYYYRGISYISLGKTAEAKADLEKYVSMAPADAPELATAKQILQTIK